MRRAFDRMKRTEDGLRVEHRYFGAVGRDWAGRMPAVPEDGAVLDAAGAAGLQEKSR